jgi:hypothetical protein
MNQHLLAPGASSLDASLRLAAPEVTQESDRLWLLCLENRFPLRVSAPVDDSFLLFDAPAPAACELEQAAHWLLWNASFVGHAKIALLPHPWRLRLRSEIPLDEEANISARISETLHGLRTACRLLAGQPDSADAAPLAVLAGDGSGHKPGNLPALLRETGWPFQERAGGVAAVELAMRGSCRVLLEENTFGVRAAMELLRSDSLAPRSLLALAALLLSAGGTLRLARPYAADAAGTFTCGFEVQFAGEITAGELEHALEALAVACWACKEEVHSILENSVAESYLAIRNLPPLLAREEF